MNKLIQNSVTLIFIFFLFGSSAQAKNNFLEIYIEADYKKNVQKQLQEVNLKIKKDKETSYKDIIAKYELLEEAFSNDYSNNRKLISDSSTIKQAFEHSKKLLETCIEYTNRYNNLKEEALMQLLVGHWSGDLTILVKEKNDGQELVFKRVLEVDFEADRVGQISKGNIKGFDKFLKEASSSKKKELTQEEILEYIDKDNVPKTSNVKGSILGSIVPQADTKLFISFEDTSNNKLKEIEIVATSLVDMKPIVSKDIINEAYSLTISYMKIYYNLLFKTRKTDFEALKDKYNLFFNDLLFLLKVVSLNYVSEEVIKPLGIYPGSDYVSSAFEDYFMTLSSYYARTISKTVSKKHKLKLYEKYLNELIHANAICQLGIINKKSVDKLNLRVGTTNSLFDGVFSRFYEYGKDYFTERIDKTEGEDQKLFKKDYKNFLEEANAIMNTGLISPETIKILSIEKK